MELALEVLRSKDERPRWKKCFLCHVYQPDHMLAIVADTGVFCLDAMRCKWHRKPMAEDEETAEHVLETQPMVQLDIEDL